MTLYFLKIFQGDEGVDKKEGLEVKSRDIGSSLSTPSKRKSKKKSEVPSAQTSSSSETNVHLGSSSCVHCLWHNSWEALLVSAAYAFCFCFSW